MTADPDREPLIVGWAQLTDHGGEGAEPAPDAMLRGVAEGALERSGRPAELLAELSTIAIVESSSWPVPNPGRPLAQALGAGPVETVRSRTSGGSPVELLADACERIAAGGTEATLIGGTECFDVLLRAMKEGRDPGFPTQPESAAPDRIVGAETEPSHPVELAAGLIAPVAYYPLIESAVRAAAGRDPDEHRRRLGELWAGFAAVAADNPYAWTRSTPSAEAIATASPENRQVTIPYTKLMNSNIQTNQAAALVVCSRAAADRAGIPVENRVRVRATAAATDHRFVCERPELARSPALAACASAAFGHAGFEASEAEHVDVYSCFPSAVGVASRELGLDPIARAPTVTGGLSFAGGPGSNYVTHSVASICERIAATGGRGIATAVGWYLTKHAVIALDGAARAEDAGAPPYAHFSPQAEIDAGERLEIVPPPEDGAGEIEAYTAICDRSGEPELGIATFRPGQGRRTVAKADDSTTLRALAESDALGAAVVFEPGGRFRIGP